jgi:uncharacterized membrane protein (TIGR01666 family)
VDYRNQYRSFINSYYLSEGLRITFGLTLPTIIGTYLHQENIGITMSLGAVCVTIVDNAGPVLHRKNAMLVCNLVIFIASLLTGFAVGSAFATFILIAVFCFVFSMIGVYGTRAGSIGLAGLFVMVLNFTHRSGAEAIILNALYILCGGVWYMMLSLSLYSFRPYKVTQQALGDLIETIGVYMLERTAFYEKNPDYDRIYIDLLEKQAEINDKQNLVRELLYKSRDIVKESTNTGRITLLIFIEINDLFERIMSLQLHHKVFHQYFDNSDILRGFKNFLLHISEQLNETGIALKSGRAYPVNRRLENELASLKKEFEDFRAKQISADNVEGFIELRALLNACDDFVSRIQTIQQYTSYDIKDIKKDNRVQNYDQFVSHQDFDAKVFLDNFNWKSNTFRHALRVAVATTTGFLISEFFPFGHGYWIMLTIIVILKPAYSITKGRNRDRLLGTVAGAAIGVLILVIVKDKHLMIGFMLVLMVLAYSFMRTRYLWFVTLMTPYILILLYILNPLHFKDLILDRVIDTAIGSVIALLANLLFSPEWTYRQFAEYLQQMLDANKNYFIDVTSFFTGTTVTVNQYKLSRKNAYVALANISDALNRMMSEPKSKQIHVTEYQELVVLNYMMATHIATLATIALGKTKPNTDPEYLPIVQAVNANLDLAMKGLKTVGDHFPISLNKEIKKTPAQISSEISGMANGLLTEPSVGPANDSIDSENSELEGRVAAEGLRKLNQRSTDMVEIRKKELAGEITEGHLHTSLAGVKLTNDQFNFIWKISEDLLKALNA